MKTSTRIIIAIVTAIASFLAFTVLGFVLNQNGIRGPFLDGEYLTEWARWRFVVLGLTLCVTLLVAGLTGFMSGSSGEEPPG